MAVRIKWRKGLPKIAEWGQWSWPWLNHARSHSNSNNNPGSQCLGFPGGASGKEPACQYRRLKRHGFSPWVRKIPWRRVWQPTPVFLPGESHGQRSLVGYSLKLTKWWTRLKGLSTHAASVCCHWLALCWLPGEWQGPLLPPRKLTAQQSSQSSTIVAISVYMHVNREWNVQK